MNRPGMEITRTIRLDYPLERVTEPVVTRLVTQFDLEPNILRANVESQKGGWLVVGLTGEADRMTAAMDWLNQQGLTVTEAA